MNKRITFVGCFILIILLMTSCNQNSVSEINNELISNTFKIEELDHKLSNFRITYDEYIKYMVDLSGKIDMESNYKRKYIPDPIDLKEIKEEDLEVWVERFGGKNTVELKVSSVYDYLDIKYIYTKSSVIPQNNQSGNDELIITKRYIYVFEDEDWILAAVEADYYDSKFPIDKMKNTKFENKQVEYIQEFTLLE